MPRAEAIEFKPHRDNSIVVRPHGIRTLSASNPAFNPYNYQTGSRIADVFDALGDGDRAEELRAKAAALFERFNAKAGRW